MKSALRFAFVLTLLTSAVPSTLGQGVAVTVTLDKAKLAVGETTTLHVYGQIVPARRAAADRIFSWYVDLLNETGAAAKLEVDALARPVADKDPATSSGGVTDGAHRRGIYDTFLNLAGAGRDAPVELLSVPVRALAAGRTVFNVVAGSGGAGLGSDFIVAPADGGEPLLGGDYSGASANLEVTASGESGPAISITTVPLPNNQGLLVTLKFPTTAGSSHFVEFRNSLVADASWQPLPGAPHNAGSATDSSTVPIRFYRLRVTTP
jgi:hypothetical protein